jgi:hypothetical protein
MSTKMRICCTKSRVNHADDKKSRQIIPLRFFSNYKSQKTIIFKSMKQQIITKGALFLGRRVKSTFLLEGPQAMPTRPSDKDKK